MKRSLLATIFLTASMKAVAIPVSWELMNFKFSDGGTAYGSFNYDNDTKKITDIDIYTTSGSMLSGRHYIAPAGDWGNGAEFNIFAFSNTTGPNFTDAGWFRIDAEINFNATPGAIVTQSLNVGAESFCINYYCSSAANEITNPGQSRDTISGYLIAKTPVPEPSLAVLSVVGLAMLVARNTSTRRNKRP